MIHGQFDLTWLHFYHGMFHFACMKHVLFKSTGITLQKNVETKCVRRIVSEIHLLVCSLNIAAISCSSTGVLLCTWDIIYSVATGLAPKSRTTSTFSLHI